MPSTLGSPPLHRHTHPSLVFVLLTMICLAVTPVFSSTLYSFTQTTMPLTTNTIAKVVTTITTTSQRSSASTPFFFNKVNYTTDETSTVQSINKSSFLPTRPITKSSSHSLPSILLADVYSTTSPENNNVIRKRKGPYFKIKNTVNDRLKTEMWNSNDSFEVSDVTFSPVFYETDSTFGGNDTYLGELEITNWSGAEICLTFIKAIVMAAIIIVSILGNILVIVSIALHRRLHSTANYLLVSLATADMLVALCAMTFNASVELSGGRWMFGRIMCDLWNSFDVYFSTVSILHLCCISVDRYYAIVRPLEYPLTITRRILAIMLAHCWLAPTLISFLPIMLGWYTTADHLRSRESQPYVCAFVVNAVFALVSSAVSFWVPCTVMVVMYFRIFQEARKQERALLSRASSANSTAYSASIRLNAAAQQQQQQQQQQQFQQQDPQAASIARQQLLIALQSTPVTPATRHQEFLMKTLSDASSTVSVATTSSGIPSLGPSGSSSSRSSSGAGMVNNVITGNGANSAGPSKTSGSNGNNIVQNWRHSRHGSTASWHGPTRHSSLVPCNRRLHSTPIVTGRTGPPPVGRREHKAARTLGLIMGAFVLCWLPFFIWYVSINICGPSCHCPPAVVTALFWIGYFNSTLNPFIYAYFRSDFRDAFHRTLKRMSCCKPRQPAGVFV